MINNNHNKCNIVVNKDITFNINFITKENMFVLKIQVKIKKIGKIGKQITTMVKEVIYLLIAIAIYSYVIV